MANNQKVIRTIYTNKKAWDKLVRHGINMSEFIDLVVNFVANSERSKEAVLKVGGISITIKRE